jgi:hypothetical protein
MRPLLVRVALAVCEAAEPAAPTATRCARSADAAGRHGAKNLLSACVRSGALAQHDNGDCDSCQWGFETWRLVQLNTRARHDGERDPSTAEE